jgi:hypothetical protein
MLEDIPLCLKRLLKISKDRYSLGIFENSNLSLFKNEVGAHILIPFEIRKYCLYIRRSHGTHFKKCDKNIISSRNVIRINIVQNCIKHSPKKVNCMCE